MPKYWNNPFKKLEVNLALWPDMITFGIPCNLKTSFMKILDISLVLCVDFRGIKWDALENLSTTTKIESWCFPVMGNLVVKSTDIISHFHFGMAKGCNNLVGYWCSTLACWYSDIWKFTLPRPSFYQENSTISLLLLLFYDNHGKMNRLIGETHPSQFSKNMHYLECTISPCTQEG